MQLLRHILDIFLHLDKHLADITQQYGAWTYGLLALIVFAETGLVITPFLPGDSLLFAAGALAHPPGAMRPEVLTLLLSAAAILGDTVNYGIGKYLGPHVLKGNSRFFKKQYLDKTHAFYEKYGGKTIILARFVPIVRTFAPFVAGVGTMNYTKFLIYNVIGGVAWVASCVYAGFFFGGLETIKKNFHLVILAIIFISILPMIVEFLRYRLTRRASVQTPME